MSRESSLDLVCLIGLLAAFTGIFFVLRPHGLIVNDDGWYLHPVLRMREGELLYRDVYTYYAPLPSHALSAIFTVTGPSILVARTFWIFLLLGTIAGSYRVARRLAPPSIAWLPAVAYGLAPGPWHKAAYGFCTVLFFLALFRALERRTVTRLFLLGAVAGITLMTRQELGVVQAALAMTVPALATGLASGFTRATVIEGARSALLAATGLAAAVAPTVAYYAAAGAMTDLVGAVFGQAASYSSRAPLEFLRLVDPRTLGSTYEGGGIGLLLLVPLAILMIVLASLARALRERPLTTQTLVVGALVVHAFPAFVQGYNPPLLVRYLQSAMPIYLLLVWFLSRLAGPARRVATGLAVLFVAVQSFGVIAGFEQVQPSGAYTGSLRLLRYRTPVLVLGDTVLTDEAMAREIASARDFFDRHTRPGEPIFAAPLHSLWYVLLDRPNPTAFLGDMGDRAMSVARKEREMARLLASDARYALVDAGWWQFRPAPGRTLTNTLKSAFRPITTFGSLVILERLPTAVPSPSDEGQAAGGTPPREP